MTLQGYHCNLVIVHTPGLQALSDFTTIKSLIAERAPEIEVFILTNRMRHSVTRKWAAGRRTLVFSPVPIERFSPLRGKVYACRRLGKLEEIRRLADAGLPVPDTALVEPDTRLDPRRWGPLSVVKPIAGLQGHGVRLRRTIDVRWTDPRSGPVDDPGFGQARLAQRFIDTGPFSRSHRVLVVFGRCVYSIVSRQLNPRRAIDPDAADSLDLPIASNAGERCIELNFEPDVIDLACRAARAFPDIPVLGVDVVREAATSDLYILEVNAAGYTWQLSSDYGQALQKSHNLDLAAQFGALDIIANTLIDVTRGEAE
jgi:hypothetical protein